MYDRVPDVETFLTRFKDFDIIEVNESESYLISSLIDDFNTLKLKKTFDKISALVKAGRIEDAINVYKDTSENLKSGISLKAVDIIRDTSRYEKYLDKCENKSSYFVSTGFKELDEILGGGFDRKGELALIVARTGMGKSWTLLKCAVASAEQGLRVGIYSGEMSEDKVGTRADTLIGHINNGGIMHGNEIFKESYKEYIDSLSDKVKGSIYVMTPSMINGPATVNALKLFVEKYHLDCLFIDQISLLEDQKKGKTSADRVSNISKDLTLLQNMKKIPIISISQQNRTVSESGQDTTQIALSDRLGQDSTLIIFLERKKDNIMELTLGKCRDNGSGRKLSYNVDLNKGYFVYLPEDGEEVSQELADSYKRTDSVDAEDNYF